MYTYISEYYFQNRYTLIGKYILVIYHSLLVIRNFRCTCSSIELLKGYMVKESLITLVRNQNPVSSLWGSFGGLIAPNKAPSPPNRNMKHYKSVEFCQFLKCQATLHKPKAPRSNANLSIENFLVTVLTKPRRQRQAINESVCCFDWFITWFTGLRGNKWNRILAERQNGENSSKTFPC